MRRKPTAFFLGDCAFLSDAKFRKLARRLPDHDAFNSAVGAYFIALAAARRNGVPSIDFFEETESSFTSDLLAVGLITSEGFPEQAFGEWAPSRPRYASDDVAPNAPKVTNGSESYEHSGAQVLPSLPFPSTSYVEGGVGGDDGRADLEAWLIVKRRAPSERQRAFLDAYCATFDVTGPARAERLILANPADPIAALKADLDAFRAERLAALPPEPKRPERRPRGLTGVNAELAAFLREQEATA